MSFEDHKAFWEEFIQLYQENPCLWDIRTKDYRNKSKKNAAYQTLINKCKELFPNANKEFVTKKISSLRASFRRQIRRINSATKSGVGTDVPESTLWYFDLLFFLLDQEESRPAEFSFEENELDNQSQASENDSDTQGFGQLSPVFSPETPQRSTSSSRKKRTLNSTSWTKKKQKFLKTSLKVLQKRDTTQQKGTEPQEITFGKNIGQQLQEIEARQKIIAQKLISDVLFHAKLGTLTDSSLISLGSQPAPYQINPYVPQAPVSQQMHPNFPTSTQSTYTNPRNIRQPEEVSSPQTFTSTEMSQNVKDEFLCFQKKTNT